MTALVGIVSAVDYCALPTCLDKHIACNNKGVSKNYILTPSISYIDIDSL